MQPFEWRASQIAMTYLIHIYHRRRHIWLIFIIPCQRTIIKPYAFTYPHTRQPRFGSSFLSSSSSSWQISACFNRTPSQSRAAHRLNAQRVIFTYSGINMTGDITNNCSEYAFSPPFPILQRRSALCIFTVPCLWTRRRLFHVHFVTWAVISRIVCFPRSLCHAPTLSVVRQSVQSSFRMAHC